MTFDARSLQIFSKIVPHLVLSGHDFVLVQAGDDLQHKAKLQETEEDECDGSDQPNFYGGQSFGWKFN